ncbi:MAG: di-trans,poly-cis-decaprenylcistransferase [Lentisphaeria bacterium]|nr:di-trans,poly-cis-decaprenylcistransferase [Lentisphaeria bacterium]
MSGLRHVAIIMDGNGRWAEAHGVPRAEGHRQGSLQVETVLDAAGKLGIKYVTLYAFSTENWKRSPAEVLALMKLLEQFSTERLPRMMEKNIRLRVIGRITDIPLFARQKLLEAVEKTSKNDGNVLTLALSYGGRAEIVDAVNRILAEKNDGKITEESFRNYLYAPDIPDPDLLIRTSGELRLSNFLLWELAYSEIYVTDVLWPDFGEEELKKAVEAFNRRDRRFGGRTK